ncbi:MAG: MMPL family transporter [Cyclobacteriaceae bacterium]
MALIQLPKLDFNYDFDNFFAKDDEEWLFYQQYVDQYGQDNDYLLIAVKSETGLFNQPFLTAVDTLINQLKRIEGVDQIISPLSIRKFVQSPLGPIAVPYLHPDDSGRLLSDSVHISTHPNLADFLINEASNSLAFLVFHQRYDDKKFERQLVGNIELKIAESGLGDYHMAGRLKAQTAIINLVKDDFLLFLVLSLILIICFLFWLFKKAKWVISSLIIIGLSIVCCLAVMVATGQGIDVMSSMLPTILLVVAMSDIVHFLTRYFDMIAKGQPKMQAIKLTWKEVGLATFLTSLTTAVGFASLAITDSLPVRNLGIYTATGVFITYLVTFSLLPSISILTSPAHVQSSHKTWNYILGKTFVFILKNTKSVVWVSLLLIGLSVWGISIIIVDSPLIADFPKDHQITRDFKFFDNNYNGAKSFEVAIEVLDDGKTVFDEEVVQSIELVDEYLKKSFEISNLTSPASIIKSMNMAFNGGQPEAYGLPDNERTYNRIQRQIKRIEHHLPTKIFNGDNPQKARITGLYQDIGSRAGLKKTKAFEAFVAEKIDPNLVSFKRTGTSHLFDITIQYLTDNIIFGLSIGIGVVALIMALLFRSVKMVVIALIPNILPIAMTAAIMGFTGIPLRLSTSIIFAVAFGIAVDNTIHYLSKYKLELNKGKNSVQALMHTTLSTGKAMIVTTLILFTGFITFTFSSFQATFFTGILISVTLVFALVTALTLLPVLLILWHKR